MIYPIGSVVIARFAFLLRPLSPGELKTFLAGNGLPSGIGTNPATVVLEYEPPEAPTVTLEGEQIVTDGVGAYHALIPVTAAGMWRYRGRGVDELDRPVACTQDQMFTGSRTF